MDKLYGQYAKATKDRKTDPKVFAGEIGVLVEVNSDDLYCLQRHSLARCFVLNGTLRSPYCLHLFLLNAENRTLGR